MTQMRTKISMKKKTAATLTAGFIVAGTAAGAYAYWTTTGGGSGTATTGTSSTVTVNQTSTPDALYPGSSVALAGNFDNPSSGPQYIASVTAAVHPFSVQPIAGEAPCTQNDFQITGTSTTPGDVPSGTGKGAWSGLSIKMLNNATAPQDNCKNLTVSDLKIDYTTH